MSGRKRNIIILDEEGTSSASKNPITAYFSPFGQGQRAKVSRPNQDSQQSILRTRQAPLIIDLTLDEDDGDDIPLAAQAAPQAAAAVHHAKSTRSAAGHTVEHTNLSQTMQFELLEAKQEVMEAAEGLVTTTESADGRAGSSAGTAGPGPAHAACSGTAAANGPATGSATSATVCTLPRARADPYEGLLVPSVDSEGEEEEKEEEEDVGSAAEEFVMGEPYPSSDSSDAERERESDRDDNDSSAADGTRDKKSVAKGLPKRGARGKRAAAVAGKVTVAAAKPETTAPKPKKAGAATSNFVPAPASAPDHDEEEEEAEEECVEHPLDDWTPTRSRAEMGAASVVEPYEVPVFRPPENADDSSAASHYGDEEYCRNDYFRGVYSVALRVAVKGLAPTTWQPAFKKLSGAAREQAQQQLQSFKDSHAVLARTEHMFAKHLLDPASSLWQGHTRVQQEQQKHEKGAIKDAKAKSDAAAGNIIKLMWEYENICNAFCLLNFFPDTEPHLETCAGTGTAALCSFLSVSSITADRTRLTIRNFLTHDGKNIPIGDQAIAVSTLRSNLYHAMNARRHLKGGTQGPPIYVLPSADEMHKVIAQAIRGSSMAQIVRPACTIISALKTLICHQTKPVASKCCRGGHPRYPRHVSMLRLQRELGLDFDWKYEPSFLEFAAVLDKSVFLLEHFHKDTPQSCKLPWGADILLGPAVALDFMSTVLCRMRRHDSTTYAYDESRVPHEHDMNRVPLLIKVLHQENVPSARVLRLLMFQTVRLVRLEKVFSHLGTKTDEKGEHAAAFLRNISLVIGACTMLLIALDRYVSVHVQGKASLSTTIQARDNFYSSLLSDVKGILPADMLSVQQAVVRSPLVAAGFTKSSSDIFSFRHEPLQHLLQMLTLRQVSAVGTVSDMQREGLVKAMQYAHLSNQLPLQEFIRLQSANQRRNVPMNGEKQESDLHDKFLRTMTSAAENVLRQLDTEGTRRLTPTAQAAAVTPDAMTRNADPVEALVRRMIMLSSMKSTR